MEKEKTLFEQAKESKLLLHWFLAGLLLILIMYGGSVLGGLLMGPIYGLMMGLRLSETSMDLGLQLIGLYGLIYPILLVFAWVKIKEKRPIACLGLSKEGMLKKFLKGFGIGLLMLSAVTLLMWAFGIIKLDQGIGAGLQSIPMILLFLPAWIIQSSSEEILTRGWYMNVMGAKYTPAIGLIASSSLFGLIHIANPGANVLSILNIILIGFLFGLYVIHTQDVWGACGMHAAWNFAQANLFGFSVSGLGLNSDSLLKFTNQGANFLTGGAFGPEANIFSTVIIVIGIVILGLKLKSKSIGELQ